MAVLVIKAHAMQTLRILGARKLGRMLGLHRFDAGNVGFDASDVALNFSQNSNGQV